MKSGHFDLSQAGAATRRRNPQIFQIRMTPKQRQEWGEKYDGVCVGTLVSAATKPPRRIHQDKPMNKLEEEFGEWLARTFPAYRRYPQAIRLKLANGVTYTPDWFCPDILKFYEVKGPVNRDDAVVKLKQAPHEHPWARFSLVWKDESTGEWQEQEIKP